MYMFATRNNETENEDDFINNNDTNENHVLEMLFAQASQS